MLLIYYAIEVSSVREGQTKKLICKLKLSSRVCCNGWSDFYTLASSVLVPLFCLGSLYSVVTVSN